VAVLLVGLALLVLLVWCLRLVLVVVAVVVLGRW
jgi:hypothetical protein